MIFIQHGPSWKPKTDEILKMNLAKIPDIPQKVQEIIIMIVQNFFLFSMDKNFLPKNILTYYTRKILE